MALVPFLASAPQRRAAAQLRVQPAFGSDVFSAGMQTAAEMRIGQIMEGGRTKCKRELKWDQASMTLALHVAVASKHAEGAPPNRR
jgi:hypothetical protein